MGRKGIEVTSLHNCTVEKLKKMRNSEQNEFARNVLTAVIMRYERHNTINISKFLLKTKQTIINYIKSWNSLGLKSLQDGRGALNGGTFTAEMKDDLESVVLNRRPNDFGFIGNVWTCPLLVEYINQNYGIKYSDEYIRVLLKERRLSYKRVQRKPSKADKKEQEVFKKNANPSPYCRKFF